MRIAILCVPLCAASIASAAPLAKVIRTNPFIETVNVATNTEATVSSAIFQTDSLAMDPAGSLFSADPNGVLFNVTTPANFPIGPTGFTQIGDLDYANGGLWGFSNANQTLFFFDFSATAVTYSVTLSTLSPLTITGVAHRPSDGSIFLSGYQSLNNDLLFQVLPSATSANLVGAMPHGDAFSYIADIDFGPSGALYAMTWFHRDFYTVNPLNGTTTFVSNGPHRDATGMALDAVPEPATISALGTALLVFTRRRVTRKE